MGWDIAENSLFTSGGWSSSSASAEIAIKGSAIGGITQPTDATLSALTLSAGTLSPAFASDTYVYTAAVTNATARITVTPTVSEASATVAWLDGADAALEDADDGTDGQQVDLAVGTTVVKVQVTAPDGTTMLTYAVTVTRAAPGNPRTEVWSATLTVGSTTNNIGFKEGFFGNLSDKTFTYEGADYIVSEISTSVGNSNLRFVVDKTLADVAVQDLTLRIASQNLRLSDAVIAGTIYQVTYSHSWSNNDSVAVSLHADALPGAPTALDAVSAGISRIDLSWTAPTEDGGTDITGYRIEASSDGGANWSDVVADTGSDATSHTHAGIMPGGARHYRVSAVNRIGAGDPSDAADAVTDAGVLVWDATLTVGDGGTETISVLTETLRGYSAADSYGALDVATFTDGTTAYTVELVRETELLVNDIFSSRTLNFTTNAQLPDNGALYAFGLSFPVPDMHPNSLRYAWSDIPSPWTIGDTVFVGFAVAGSAPGVPGGFGATGDGVSAIELDWTAPDNGGLAITGYRIEVSADGGSSWTDLEADTGSTDTTYSHTGLSAGDTRHYRVSAINVAGTGSPTGVASASIPLPVVAPGPPSNFGVTRGDEEVSLVWLPPSSNGGAAIDQYQYRYKTSGGYNSWRGNFPASASSRPVLNLVNGIEHTFQMRARNSAGLYSGPTPEVSAVPAGTPGAPQNVAASGGDGEVTLSWQPPSNDGASSILSYQYRYKTGGGYGGWNNVGGGGSARSATVGSLTNGTLHTFQVRARNALGAGDASGEVTATPTGTTTEPGPPQNLNASGGDGEATLSWQPPSSDGGAAISSYEYRYKTSGGYGGWNNVSGGGSARSATVGGLTNETLHTFQVRASNSVGPGEASGEATATPTATTTEPGPPQSLNASGGDTQATLSWQPPLSDGGAAISSYQYRHKTTGSYGGWNNVSGGGSARSATVGGLTNETLHTFQVRASNSVGAGAASGEATATPTAAKTEPGPPRGLNASGGNTQAVLSWRAPSSDGGAAISSYQYRYKTTGGYGGWNNVSGGGSARSATVGGLTNDTRYTFQVRARNSVGAGAASSAASATPNEEHATVSFSSARYSATEGGAGAQVTVVLSKPLNDGAAIVLASPDHLGGATEADYSGAPSSVFFRPGETSTTFTVTAVDDSLDDDGESVRLRFNTLSEKWRGEHLAAVVALRDNDDGVKEVAVSFGAATYSASEGGDAATVRLELDRAPGRSVTVPIERTNAGGASANDYSGVPESVTFDSSQTAKTFTVTATDDSEDDDFESVRLTLGTLPVGVSPGSPSATTVNLEDDDGGQQRLTVRFDAHYSVLRTISEAGNTYGMGVRLDKKPASPLTIPLVVTYTGGATAADHEGPPASVTFVAGDSYEQVNLRALDDDEADEEGEGLRVDFGNLPAGVSVDSWGSSATFEIIDNDGPQGVSVSDARVSGPRLTLSYAEPLDGASVPGPADWVVAAEPAADAGAEADGGWRALTVVGVAVRNADVLLDLWPPATSDDAVTLSYLPWPMHPLATASGIGAAPLTELTVRNDTPPGAVYQPWLRLAPVPEGAEATPERERLPLDLAAHLRSLLNESPSSLRRLDLAQRDLTDLSALAWLTGLEVLDLRGNAVADVWPLAGLTGLRRLDLSDNRIADVSALAGLSRLEVLILDGNAVSDALPLSQLPRLAHLALSGNRVADAGLLADLPSLVRLDLSGNAVSDLSPLGDLGRLVWVDVSGNPVSDAAPLGRLTALRWLWLDPGAAGIDALLPMTERRPGLRIGPHRRVRTLLPAPGEAPRRIEPVDAAPAPR